LELIKYFVATEWGKWVAMKSMGSS